MFSYKKYTYTEFIEKDEDYLWYIHQVTYTDSTGINEVLVDYSQYEKMTKKAFKLLVDLNFPSRPEGSVTIPWNEERLEKYSKELEYAKEYTLNNDSLTDL